MGAKPRGPVGLPGVPAGREPEGELPLPGDHAVPVPDRDLELARAFDDVFVSEDLADRARGAAWFRELGGRDAGQLRLVVAKTVRHYGPAQIEEFQRELQEALGVRVGRADGRVTVATIDEYEGRRAALLDPGTPFTELVDQAKYFRPFIVDPFYAEHRAEFERELAGVLEGPGGAELGRRYDEVLAERLGLQ